MKKDFFTAIDLFAGAGGLTTGLKAGGFAVRGAVEIDKASVSTYKMNHPETKVFLNDVRALTGPKILKAINLAPGELDLLTGCPPCQGFSTLRTRNRGLAPFDPRNDLVFHFLRLARSIRPKAIILENVPGFASDERFIEFCKGLSQSGYILDFDFLNAIHFGVPQRRKRLVLLALRKPAEFPNFWSRPTHTEHRTVGHTISHLPPVGGSGDPLHDFPEKRSERVISRIKATPKNGGSRRDIPAELRLKCHLSSNGYSDVYGRMAWNKVSPTITSGCTNPSKGRFIHPEEDRAITLREAALLQTFPKKYKFDISKGKEQVAKQIGNAFPPKLIEPIASLLTKEVLQCHPS